MRTFKCYDCDYIWQLPHGEGGRGTELKCPKCGSGNVHREHKGANGDRRGRRQRTAAAEEK
jgi:phage FluMu protein Com